MGSREKLEAEMWIILLRTLNGSIGPGRAALNSVPFAELKVEPCN